MRSFEKSWHVCAGAVCLLRYVYPYPWHWTEVKVIFGRQKDSCTRHHPQSLAVPLCLCCACLWFDRVQVEILCKSSVCRYIFTSHNLNSNLAYYLVIKNLCRHILKVESSLFSLATTDTLVIRSRYKWKRPNYHCIAICLQDGLVHQFVTLLWIKSFCWKVWTDLTIDDWRSHIQICFRVFFIQVRCYPKTSVQSGIISHLICSQMRRCLSALFRNICLLAVWTIARKVFWFWKELLIVAVVSRFFIYLWALFV